MELDSCQEPAAVDIEEDEHEGNAKWGHKLYHEYKSVIDAQSDESFFGLDIGEIEQNDKKGIPRHQPEGDKSPRQNAGISENPFTRNQHIKQRDNGNCEEKQKQLRGGPLYPGGIFSGEHESGGGAHDQKQGCCNEYHPAVRFRIVKCGKRKIKQVSIGKECREKKDYRYQFSNKCRSAFEIDIIHPAYQEGQKVYGACDKQLNEGQPEGSRSHERVVYFLQYQRKEEDGAVKDQFIQVDSVSQESSFIHFSGSLQSSFLDYP